MHASALPETHLMFSRMRIDVHRGRVEFEKQHIGWMPAMVKHIMVGLAYGVSHQFVTNHATIDVKILHVSLAA